MHPLIFLPLKNLYKMIGMALTLASLAASAYGASQSAKQQLEIDRQISRRRTELESWLAKEEGTSFFDTTSGKSAVKLLLENMRKENEALQGSAATTGASTEAVTAQKERFMENYSNAIAKMLGYDTERKEAARRDYMGMKTGVEDLELQNIASKQQNWANFMSNAANLGQSAILGQSMGAFGEGNNFLQKLLGAGGTKGWANRNQNWLGQSMLNIGRSGMAGVNRNPYILTPRMPMIWSK